MAKRPLLDHPFRAAWRMPALLILLLVMIVSGCAGLSERTGQISIDSSFTNGGFRWDDGRVVYVFVKVRQNQGKVEVCAAFMPTKGSVYTVNLSTQILGAAIIKVGGTRVMQGIAFANQIPLVDNVRGQSANCARGTADWKPSYAQASVELKFPRMRIVL